MPTASGQYQLNDYIVELQNRGFDGFSPADLTTYINRGYMHVARRSTWYWEQTTDNFTLTPGQFNVTLWPLGTELPNFKSLDKVVVTTANHTAVLEPQGDEEFWPNLGLDLTQTSIQGEPTEYYVFQQKLYILPPPQAQRDFLAYYHRRVSPLVAATDAPITPQHLHDAILQGALIHCHKRANEPPLAQFTEQLLEEFFDDMRDDEEMLMAEQLDRVSPDDTWL